ncbi:hypothetical protein ACHAWF_015325 [Thalassiosira exigua]
MKLPSLLAATAAMSPTVASSSGNDGEQCYGRTPMPSVSTYLGASLDYSIAEHICCNNHRWAEDRGYLASPEVDLFGRLNPANQTVFYDSVCGLPLFVAPRGRTFEEFRDESLKHGWPSFRPEEMVSENVILHDDGRMESACLTHLGHNLPEGGVDRYCVDLVCVAGEPLSPDDERANILEAIDQSAIEPEEFDVDAYASSAETFSGKQGNSSLKYMVGLVGFFAVAVAALIFHLGKMKLSGLKDKKSGEEQWKGVNTKDSAESG